MLRKSFVSRAGLDVEISNLVSSVGAVMQAGSAVEVLRLVQGLADDVQALFEAVDYVVQEGADVTVDEVVEMLGLIFPGELAGVHGSDVEAMAEVVVDRFWAGWSEGGLTSDVLVDVCSEVVLDIGGR